MENVIKYLQQWAVILIELYRIADGNGTTHGETGELWRIHILDELKARLKKITLDPSIVYERAVEK